MIIALLALALAMILGGLFTIFLGWDIILVERGWTMVLAGSISAAGGALLLGITAAVSKLARIQAELARLHGAFQGGSPHAAMPLAPVEPSAAALPGGVLGAPAAGATEDRDEIEPLLPFPDRDRPAETLEDEEAAEGPSDRSPASEHAEAVVPFRPRIYAGSPSSPEEEPLGAKVPEFLLGDRFRDADEEARTPEPDVSLPAAEPAAEEPEEKPEPGVDAAEDVTPAAWPAPEAEVPEAVETVEPAVSAEPEPEPEAVPEEPRPVTIVGTYNSGDNRYVMFSDGSIEAQTPGGVFRFNSLDELKEFIASGGEGGSTAA